MKPFNLAEALAGKPVVNRDGKKVVHIADTGFDIEYPVAYIVEHHAQNFPYFIRRNGTYVSGSSKFDLFMATEKVTKYINIYEGNSTTVAGELYDTEAEAKAQILKHFKFATTVPVTYEK